MDRPAKGRPFTPGGDPAHGGEGDQGKVTSGFDHPGCFMRGDGTCSNQLCGEHYLSRNILLRLGPAVDVNGMPWQEKGDWKTIPVSGLKVRVLCTRHNNSLSALDDNAGKAFDAIGRAVADATKSVGRSIGRPRQLSGEFLQLWAIKLFLGAYHGGILARDGVKFSKMGAPDLTAAVDALRGKPLPKFLGLYVVEDDEPVDHRYLQITPLGDVRTGELSGLRWCFHGVYFDVIVSRADRSSIKSQWRPTELLIRGPNATGRAILNWASRSEFGQEVYLSLKPI